MAPTRHPVTDEGAESGSRGLRVFVGALLLLAAAVGAWRLSIKEEAVGVALASSPDAAAAPDAAVAGHALTPPSPEERAKVVDSFYGFCPKPGERLPHFRVPQLISVDPESPLAAELGHAAAARRLFDTRGERTALAAAFRLAPDDAAIAYALGEALANTRDVEQAVTAYDVYLRNQPKDIQTARKRARLGVQADIQRGWPSRELNGLTLVYPPGPLAGMNDQQMLLALSSALDDAAAFTGVRRRDELTVVVYPGREELLAVSCAATWAAGYYDGVLRLIEGTNLRIIRHEILHAQLAGTGVYGPAWFHEGLAESFAPRPNAFRKQLALMVKNHTWVPLESMQGPFAEMEESEDASLAYAQAYLMVQYLLRHGGSDTMAHSVGYLAEQKDPRGLFKAVLGAELDEADLLRLASDLSGPGP